MAPVARLTRLVRLIPQRRARTVEDSRMSLVEHLREFRSRLLKALLGVAVVTLVVAIWVYHPVFDFLRAPYCDLPVDQRTGGIGCQLVFTHPADAFLVRLKVSLIAGVVLSAPIWLYQLWAFITPGLHRNERRWAIAFVATSLVLFALGVTVAYLVLGPALDLLLGIAGEGVTPLLEVTQYLSFVTSLLVIFGVSFEFPLVIVLLNFAGVVSSERLRHWRRAAIFAVFVFAGVATPTQDPFSMLAMAGPLCLLYELAILVARLNDRRRARRDAASEFAGLADDEASPTPVAAPVDEFGPEEAAPEGRPAPVSASRIDSDTT